MVAPWSRAALLAVLLWAVPARAELPENAWVVWASNRLDGRHEIYIQRASGGEPRRLTMTGGQFPAWSPDGSWVAYNHTEDSTTHVIRWDGTGDKKVCDGLPMFWMHDNSGVVCAVLRTDWVGFEGMSRSEQYVLANPYLDTQAELFKRSDFKHLADDGITDRHLIPGGITRDGHYLVGWVFGLFEAGYQADNGWFESSHSAVVLDLFDKSKLYFLGPGCTTTTPPRGPLVYHVSRDGLTAPDVFSLDVNDLAARGTYHKVAGRDDADWGHDYFPRISTDNRWLTYGASQSCHPWYECDYEIFLHELGTDDTTAVRFTDHKANDNYPHMFVGELWKADPNPRMLLTPDVAFFHGSSDSLPQPKRIAVASVGDRPLGAVTARVTSGGYWLSVTPTSVNGHTELILDPNAPILPTGTYDATVEVAAGAMTSPQKLEAQITFANSDPNVVLRLDAGPDAAPVNTAPGGCHCSAGGARSPALAWLLVLVPLLRRRR